jgi:hypothetical protein
MRHPFKHRPAPGEDNWENNWVSNAMAWGSQTLLPKACKNPGAWHIKFMVLFWAECSCCLFYRGVVVGAVLSAALTVALT